MENKKEKTTPNVSVGADMEQPIQKIAENSISEYEENIKSFEEMRRRKFTVGIIVAETAGCVSDISVQFNTFLYYTSFVFFLQVLYFYNPQICALNHAYFFTSVLTLWFMLSIYFPSLL